jgi:type I restriction enzyme S subunit
LIIGIRRLGCTQPNIWPEPGRRKTELKTGGIMSQKTPTIATKEEAKPALVPKLRFPEFRGEEGWKQTTLGELSEVVRGGSPRPIDGFLTTSPDGLNWLKIGDVDKEAKFVTHTAEKVRREALTKTRVVNPGDLILSNSMSFGRPYILQITTCIHDGWIAITSISNETERDFLYYLISAPSSQSYFVDNAAGSGVQNLNAEIIKALLIRFPTPPEQQKIADCLSSVDELIAAQARKVDALKTHKKGLMQQLFPIEDETQPRLRFPEFRDAGDWEIKPLKKLFTIGSGRDYKHLSLGSVPVYGSGGYMLSIDEFLYDGESVCIGRKGTINKPMFITGKFWTVDTLFYTYSFQKCLPKFIYAIFQQIEWLKHNEAGGVPSLSKAIIEKIEVAVPSPQEQKRIADCLTSLDNLITAAAQELVTFKTHKKALMQQLFPSAQPPAP